MSEMIERVKAAIAEKLEPAINMRAPYAKVMVDMAARAAIQAMREPTEEMADAGYSVVDAYYDSGPDKIAVSAWESMIAAALTNGTKAEAPKVRQPNLINALDGLPHNLGEGEV